MRSQRGDANIFRCEWTCSRCGAQATITDERKPRKETRSGDWSSSGYETAYTPTGWKHLPGLGDDRVHEVGYELCPLCVTELLSWLTPRMAVQEVG